VPITEQDIRKLAHLARLDVDESELPRIKQDLAAILDYVAQLQEVDVTGVDPVHYVMPTELRLRPDAVVESEVREDALAASRRLKGRFFTVPGVILKDTSGR